MKKRKWIILIVGVSFLAAFLAIVAWRLKVSLGPYSPARKAWKEQAIIEINGRIGNKEWLEGEKKEAKERYAGDGRWASEEVVLMKNGDWIICRNVCARQDNGISLDLFIGYGSDGKWHYSTFHFCHSFITLMQCEQSPTMAEFVKTFHVHEFDGHSDECLKKTCPWQR